MTKLRRLLKMLDILLTGKCRDVKVFPRCALEWDTDSFICLSD